MGEVRIYYGEALGRYGFGRGHPFGPDRLEAFYRELEKQGLAAKVFLAPPVAATKPEIARFHTPEYIERVERQSETGEGYLDTGDTPAFRGMFEAASFVAGSMLDAVARAIDGSATRSFVPIAGLHHARRDSAAGFCVFNDLGIAIETLRRVYGVKRIAYVDIDAHHGDGIYYEFEEDPELFVVDLHEDGRFLYPGTGFAWETGKGQARGTKLNIPLFPGADDEVFRQAWGLAERFLSASRPEFILLQAGADSLAGDPIAQLRLSPASHALAAERLCRIAEEFSKGRLVAAGGGGYDRRNLALAWTAVVRALLG